MTTPAHFDEYQKVACVVCGARRFTLFAFEQTPNLSVDPLDLAHRCGNRHRTAGSS